jgi:quercetin dioxygenase-like cupin family protein
MSAIRRVVTGHDSDGVAVILDDRAAPNAQVRPAAGNLVSTLLWVTDEAPADISAAGDRADRTMGTAPPPMGSVFRVVEFPPEDGAKIDNEAVLRGMGIAQPNGAPAPRHFMMHRTKSIDYAIVMDGEIWLLLDKDEVLLKSGDTVVQQGTNHSWANRSDRPCRIAFVLIDADAPPAWTLQSGRP